MFDRTIPAAIGIQKLGLTREFSPRASQKVARDKRDKRADDNLVRILESEMECAKEPKQLLDDIPNEFAFEIEDEDGKVTLTREYKGEEISIEVHVFDISEKIGLGMDVTITSENPYRLKFDIMAHHNEIRIDTFSCMPPLMDEEDDEDYEELEFKDLGENLQNAIYKYLEVRGIKTSMTNFLFKYMESKDDRQYLMRLKNFKNFVEKKKLY